MAKRPKEKLTVVEIAERFEEAALTEKRMPDRGRPRGFASSWPEVVRSKNTAYGFEQARMRVVPSAREIQRMEEAQEWPMLLRSGDDLRDKIDRDIIWGKAAGLPGRAICRRAGLSRSQVHRRWQAALITIEKRLGARRSSKSGAGGDPTGKGRP